MHTWQNPAPSDSTWEIQGQDQSMQKEKLPEDRLWRYSVYIWSSQMVCFTSWSKSPRETYKPKNIGDYLKGYQRQFCK